jgi:polar amino acid transport system substrate-binding protein
VPACFRPIFILTLRAAQLRRLLLLFCISFLSGIAASAAQPVRACAANLEYPPYLYAENQGGRHDLAGLSLDILQYALRKNGKSMVRVQRLPWLRCLKLVELGEMDLVLNVPTAQIESSPFLISEPYAIVHSVYFVSSANAAKGIRIGSYEDLSKYRICGLLGNRYDAYGIDTAKVDTGSDDYLSLINKVKAGHCDLFIEKREIVESLSRRNAALKAALNSPQLMQFSLPEDSPIGLHYAISRNMPGARLLLKQLDASISILRRNGKIKIWVRRHLLK